MFLDDTIYQTESACDSGCSAYAGALLFNNATLAEGGLAVVEIIAPPTPSNPDPDPVSTVRTPENVRLYQDL